MTRYDPDGNEKRRARKGERRCDECVFYEAATDWRCPPLCCTVVGLRREFSRCRADDYAGECQSFNAKE
jgi:hypothetical protein